MLNCKIFQAEKLRERRPAAIIIGSFTGVTVQEKEAIEKFFEKFVQQMEMYEIPVLSCPGLGHTERNHPIPIGTSVVLKLGKNPALFMDVHSLIPLCSLAPVSQLKI